MLSSRKATVLVLLAVAAAGLALLAPFAILGNASGHDFEFHVASWMDVAHQWRERVLYPRWAELANYGYGEPRFIFYPPASWLLGAGLSLALPWKMVPGAFFWIAMLVAGVCMYRLAREWLPDSDAVFAGLIYAVNPYHQLQLYWRSDFAELLASAIFPLLLLYAIRAGQGERRALAPLSLLFGSTWLMNAPAGVIASYSIALVLAVTAVHRRSVRGLWIGGLALAIGLALAAFYIIPAAYEQRWVQISQALSAGLRPFENFLFTWTDDPEHTDFNFRVSTMAVAEMFVAALAIFGGRKLRERRDAWWVFAILLSASGLLMVRITTPAWDLLPKLSFVQFPWRWLLVLNTGLAVVLAAALARRGRALWWTMCICGLAVCAYFQARNAWWDPGGVNELKQAILVRGTGYEGTDEYMLKGGDHYDLDKNAANVSADHSAVHIQRWRSQRKVFTVDASHGATAALRLVDYPAWQVSVNRHAVQARSTEAGQMLVDIPAGSSTVEVRFARTPDRWVGGAVSAASVLLLLLLFAMGRRERASTG